MAECHQLGLLPAVMKELKFKYFQNKICRQEKSKATEVKSNRRQGG